MSLVSTCNTGDGGEFRHNVDLHEGVTISDIIEACLAEEKIVYCVAQEKDINVVVLKFEEVISYLHNEIIYS